MDEILNLKKKILSGKNITENYELLNKTINSKKKEIEAIKSKLENKSTKKTECRDIEYLQEKIRKINNTDILNTEFLEMYTEIIENINYLENYYKKGMTQIKKITQDKNKVSIKKIQ